jgi:hypothetical protein
MPEELINTSNIDKIVDPTGETIETIENTTQTVETVVNKAKLENPKEYFWEKIKYIKENPWYCEDIDYMSLGSHLSIYNIDSYLQELIHYDIDNELLWYIMDWLISKLDWINIVEYNKILELNNKECNSMILNRLFGDIKKKKDNPWEKELFTNLVISNNYDTLYFLDGFFKSISDKGIKGYETMRKEAENLKWTIEVIFEHLDIETQKKIKNKYTEYDLELNLI